MKDATTTIIPQRRAVQVREASWAARCSCMSSLPAPRPFRVQNWLTLYCCSPFLRPLRTLPRSQLPAALVHPALAPNGLTPAQSLVCSLLLMLSLLSWGDIASVVPIGCNPITRSLCSMLQVHATCSAHSFSHLESPPCATACPGCSPRAT